MSGQIGKLVAEGRERLAAADTSIIDEWEGAMDDLAEWALDNLGALLDELERLQGCRDTVRSGR